MGGVRARETAGGGVVVLVVAAIAAAWPTLGRWTVEHLPAPAVSTLERAALLIETWRLVPYSLGHSLVFGGVALAVLAVPIFVLARLVTGEHDVTTASEGGGERLALELFGVAVIVVGGAAVLGAGFTSLVIAVLLTVAFFLALGLVVGVLTVTAWWAGIGR